ncbi:MAG: transposase family protein [Desulfotomaculaceae bacterium]
MKGHGEKLTRKQEQAIAALLLQPTIAEAARSANIGETTLWRWLQVEGFQVAYAKAKKEAVAQAVARLQQITSKAVDTLQAVMEDEEAPASSRVTAARVVLETSLKAIELEDLAARVEQLEKTTVGR